MLPSFIALLKRVGLPLHRILRSAAVGRHIARQDGSDLQVFWRVSIPGYRHYRASPLNIEIQFEQCSM